MLVLKMLLGQKIYIDGGRIEVQLVGVQGNSAKLGFTAPAEVRIHRSCHLHDGPSRCCRCGGTLPPAGSEGTCRTPGVTCAGRPDPETGRCGVFLASTLWGDAQAGTGGRDGAA